MITITSFKTSSKFQIDWKAWIFTDFWGLSPIDAYFPLKKAKITLAHRFIWSAIFQNVMILHKKKQKSKKKFYEIVLIPMHCGECGMWNFKNGHFLPKNGHFSAFKPYILYVSALCFYHLLKLIKKNWPYLWNCDFWAEIWPLCQKM